MSDENEIVFGIEADQSQADRAITSTTDLVAELYGEFVKLQTKINTVFGDDMKKAQAQLQGLVGELNRLERANQAIGRLQGFGSDPARLSRAASTRGVVSSLRDDPVRQSLAMERELNKNLEARLEIYRRLKAAMPGADDARLLRAYQSAVAQLDPTLARTPRTEDGRFAANPRRQQFMQQSLRDQAEFNARQVAADKSEYAERLALYERYLNQRSTLAKVASGKMTEQDVLSRTFQAAGQRGVNIAPEDQERMGSQFRENLQQHQTLYPAQAPRVARPALTRDERTAASVQARADRLNYMGGAPTFLAEAHTLGNYAVMGAGISAAYKTVEDLVKLQEELKAIQAASGATDTEMVKLQSDILNVGAASSKSLKDITEAATVLAHAGVPISELADSLSKITKTATATHSTVKAVAQATTDVIDTFHISLTELANVQTIIGNLSIKSKISVDDLGKAVKSSGQFAQGAGVQFQEYSAAMAAMAAAGIHDGQTIGQGIRQVIESLDNPNKKMLATLAKLGLTADDVNVRTQGLAGALENLKSHGMDSATAMTAFSIRAYGAYNAMSQQLPVMESANKLLTDNQTINRAAAANMDTFGAAGQRLYNTISKVTNEALTPMFNTMKVLMEGIAGGARVVSDFSGTLGVFGTILGSLAISVVTMKIGELAVGLLTLAKNSEATSAALMILEAIMAKDLPTALGILELALGPVGWMALGLTALVGLFSLFSASASRSARAIDETAAAANKASEEHKQYQERMKELDDYISVLVDRHAALSKNTSMAGQMAEQAMTKFAAWGLTLDANSRSVDGLIGKLVELRRQQAAQAREAATNEIKERTKQNVELSNSTSSERGRLAQEGRFLLNNPATSKALDPAILRKLMAGQSLSADELISLRTRAQGINFAGKDSFLKDIGKVSDTQNSIDLNKTVIGMDQKTVGTDTVQQTTAYSEWQKKVIAERIRLQGKMAGLSSIKDPSARFAAHQELEAEAKASQKKLLSEGQGIGANLGRDPNIGAAGAAAFSQNGDLHSIAVIGGVGQGNYTQADWRARLKMLTAQRKNVSGDKAKAIDAQIREAKIGALGPDATDEEIADAGATADAQAETRDNHAESKAKRERASLLGKQAEDVKLQIGDVSANLPLGSGDLGNDQKKLQSLLVKWKGLKEGSARADKSGPELQTELDKIDEEAKKYFAEVLRGNAKAIADTTEKAASSSAEKAKGNALLALSQGGNLDSALKSIDETAAKALQAKLDAIKADFAKSNPTWNGQMRRDLKEKLDEASASAAASLIKSHLEAIDMAAKASREQADVAYNRTVSPLQRRSAEISAAGNLFNEGMLGSTHGYMLGQEQKQIDVSTAQADLVRARSRVGTAQGVVSDLKGQIDAAGGLAKADEKLATSYHTATVELEKESEALAKAQDRMVALTAKVPPLTNAHQALSAAVSKYTTEAHLNQGVYEGLADGLDSAFGRSQQAMGTFFTDALSGTKSVKAAFRDMVLSILKALEDMVTQMMAKQIFKYILSMMPGGGPATSAASAGTSAGIGGLAGGGMVPFKHYASGGFNKDSVPALLMPGEVVLNKTAVDFMGKENLLAMNASRNRSASMPSISSAMKPREPDKVNVYVVSPDTKPQLGKNDILHVIQEDMLSNGQTKKLVRAIAIGAA